MKRQLGGIAPKDLTIIPLPHTFLTGWVENVRKKAGENALMVVQHPYKDFVEHSKYMDASEDILFVSFLSLKMVKFARASGSCI